MQMNTQLFYSLFVGVHMLDDHPRTLGRLMEKYATEQITFLLVSRWVRCTESIVHIYKHHNKRLDDISSIGLYF